MSYGASVSCIRCETDLDGLAEEDTCSRCGHRGLLCAWVAAGGRHVPYVPYVACSRCYTSFRDMLEKWISDGEAEGRRK